MYHLEKPYQHFISNRLYNCQIALSVWLITVKFHIVVHYLVWICKIVEFLESSKVKGVLKGQRPIKIHRIVKKMVLISLIL